jgi:predicted nucleotidyltransferase
MNCWEDQLILKVLAGSRAYGTNGPNSDEDSRGICIPPKNALLGLQSFEQYQDDKGDNVVFSLVKFVRLALEGNPNLIETLFTEDIQFINPWGERLLEKRDLFLSRRVAERFGHYALSQLKRLENHYRWWANPPQEPTLEDFGAGFNSKGTATFPSKEARLAYDQARKNWTHYLRWKRERNTARAELEQHYGYDTKHAMHLCRLLKMGEEILTTGKVLVRRPDAEWLLEVRRGVFPYQELLEWARTREAGLNTLKDASPLPEIPDSEAAERLLIEIIEDYFWRLKKS